MSWPELWEAVTLETLIGASYIGLPSSVIMVAAVCVVRIRSYFGD